MTPVIFSDLDDTIFTTMKGYQDHDPAGLRRVTTAKNGNHSFMCERREAILRWIAAGATLIPVTARSLDAYRRVSLCDEHFTAGAVLNNGAMILSPDGAEDLDWSDEVRTHCEAATPALTSAARFLTSPEVSHTLDIRVHRHMHGETMLGMTVKSNDETPEGVEYNLSRAQTLFSDHFSNDPVILHRNGNNLAFVPHHVSKKNAVRHLITTRPDLADRPTIGAGDSLSDLPFMELCDMMLIPARTQVSDKVHAQVAA